MALTIIQQLVAVIGTEGQRSRISFRTSSALFANQLDDDGDKIGVAFKVRGLSEALSIKIEPGLAAGFSRFTPARPIPAGID